MSATRLLVLGMVRGFGRTHGYRIGTDLISWGADDWANVKWGSIYHALRKLTDDGLLVDHDEVPGRTEYELTERGDAEFLRLLRDAVRRPQTRPDFLNQCRKWWSRSSRTISTAGARSSATAPGSTPSTTLRPIRSVIIWKTETIAAAWARATAGWTVGQVPVMAAATVSACSEDWQLCDPSHPRPCTGWRV